MLLYEENLCIRNAEINDAKIISNWWNDGKVMAHAGFPNGIGVTEQSVIDLILTDSDDTCRRLILEAGGVPIGEANYSNLGNNKVEIGIKICDFGRQGKGLGPKFLKMLISELFNIGYVKVVLDTNLNNLRAQHVYEKLGFHKVGVRLDAWTDQLGQPQSAVDYELEVEQFLV
jgi:RimJ/RimL family protein N-acetyltransferase